MEQINIKLPGTKDFFTQEAYKTLRTNLQFCGQDVKVIAFTSCSENEGKSTVSLHTAMSLAELGKKVLFVDADLRKSVIAGRNAQVKNALGLSQVLTGMVKLEDCMYMTQHPNLHVLFAGKYPPNPVELLSSRYFALLIETSRTIYDYIIIDTPPLGIVIDAAVIAPLCDGTVLVVNCGKVRHSQLHEVIAQLKKTGSRILGLVRNNSNLQTKMYYKKN